MRGNRDEIMDDKRRERRARWDKKRSQRALVTDVVQTNSSAAESPNADDIPIDRIFSHSNDEDEESGFRTPMSVPDLKAGMQRRSPGFRVSDMTEDSSERKKREIRIGSNGISSDDALGFAHVLKYFKAAGDDQSFQKLLRDLPCLLENAPDLTASDMEKLSQSLDEEEEAELEAVTFDKDGGINLTLTGSDFEDLGSLNDPQSDKEDLTEDVKAAMLEDGGRHTIESYLIRKRRKNLRVKERLEKGELADDISEETSDSDDDSFDDDVDIEVVEEIGANERDESEYGSEYEETDDQEGGCEGCGDEESSSQYEYVDEDSDDEPTLITLPNGRKIPLPCDSTKHKMKLWILLQLVERRRDEPKEATAEEIAELDKIKVQLAQRNIMVPENEWDEPIGLHRRLNLKEMLQEEISDEVERLATYLAALRTFRERISQKLGHIEENKQAGDKQIDSGDKGRHCTPDK